MGIDFLLAGLGCIEACEFWVVMTRVNVFVQRCVDIQQTEAMQQAPHGVHLFNMVWIGHRKSEILHVMLYKFLKKN